MILADAEHDKKIEQNVRECIHRAQEKCQKLKENLAQQEQIELARTHGRTDIQNLQDEMERAIKNLSDKEVEISSLKAKLNKPPTASEKKKGSASIGQAMRELSKLLSGNFFDSSALITFNTSMATGTYTGCVGGQIPPKGEPTSSNSI